MLRTICATLIGLALAGAAQAAPPGPYASIAEQQAAMASREATSEQIVRAYLARIAALDRAGPRLNSIIALNPHAVADARALDAERRAGRVRGPLHGVPILLKDNIESDDGTPTTAGSLALAANVTGRDAPLVRRLTDAGAVILGKTNLSEWANFRSSRSVSGWSAVGGLVRNPYGLDRTACGSSAGSGAAVAAGLAAGAIGTETDGSITCPAAMNGVVGLKPTVGLVSRTFIVPISAEQDTAGPMTRTVADTAAILTAIAGSDPLDPATAEADARKTDYLAGLSPGALKGVRIGVIKTTYGRFAATDAVFDEALATLKAAGAVLVDVKNPETAVVTANEFPAMTAEFKATLNAYLGSLPPSVKTRTLDDLIAFNAANAAAEMPIFGQELFVSAAKAPPLTDPTYLNQRDTARRVAREQLDKAMADNDVAALVAASGAPPSRVDPVNGSQFFGSPSALPAVAGYPHLTVPMGYVRGLPVGLSFIGPAWSEARLLALGHAFELASHARVDPTFPSNLEARPDVGRAYDPPR